MKTLLTFYFSLLFLSTNAQQVLVHNQEGNLITRLTSPDAHFTAPVSDSYIFKGIYDSGNHVKQISIAVNLNKGQTVSPAVLRITVAENSDLSRGRGSAIQRWNIADVLQYQQAEGSLRSVHKVLRPDEITDNRLPDLYLVWKREQSDGNCVTIAEPFWYSNGQDGDIQSWPWASGGIGIFSIKCSGVNCSNCSILGMWSFKNQGCDCLRIGHPDAGPSYCESEVSIGGIKEVVISGEIADLIYGE